ncbi:MAG: hypothetical protein K8T10_15485 [Candidatus Eremiobacteraeota bacterium]|nr:hypothetical protein [Candidatus Eremiobacteraeota bacterium]
MNASFREKGSGQRKNNLSPFNEGVLRDVLPPSDILARLFEQARKIRAKRSEEEARPTSQTKLRKNPYIKLRHILNSSLLNLYR